MAICLCAFDDSAALDSMTHVLLSKLNLKRIIIERNPVYAADMRKHSPRSFAVNAAIFEEEQTVHYLSKVFVGGIVEFMYDAFISDFHEKLH